MRLFFFGLAGLAAAGLTAAAVYVYPVLVVATMEDHDPWTESILRNLAPLALILSLWVGLMGAYFVTRKRS
jgi:hypothetical protein